MWWNSKNRLKHHNVQYVTTPERDDDDATRGRTSSSLGTSPMLNLHTAYSNGSRASSVVSSSAGGKRMREGSEEGEEVSTPVKKTKLDDLPETPVSEEAKPPPNRNVDHHKQPDKQNGTKAPPTPVSESTKQDKVDGTSADADLSEGEVA